jgi:hypothetical protein
LGLSILAELQDMYTSTPGVLSYQLGVWGVDGTETLARRGLLAVWAVLALGLMALLWRATMRQQHADQRMVHLLAVWFLVFFSFVMIAAPVVRPWYFLWFISIGALLPGRGYLLVVAIASLTGTLAEVVEQYFTVLPWVRESYGRQVMAPVAMQSLPAVMTLLALALRTRSLLLVGRRRGSVSEAQPASIRGESVSSVAEAG